MARVAVSHGPRRYVERLPCRWVSHPRRELRIRLNAPPLLVPEFRGFTGFTRPRARVEPLRLVWPPPPPTPEELRVWLDGFALEPRIVRIGTRWTTLEGTYRTRREAVTSALFQAFVISRPTALQFATQGWVPARPAEPAYYLGACDQGWNNVGEWCDVCGQHLPWYAHLLRARVPAGIPRIGSQKPVGKVVRWHR